MLLLSLPRNALNREVRCPSCGALNRIAPHLNSYYYIAKCGKCGATLPEPRVTRWLQFLQQKRLRSWGPAAALLLLILLVGLAGLYGLNGHRTRSVDVPVTWTIPVKTSIPPIQIPTPTIQAPNLVAVEPLVPVCAVQPNSGQIISGYHKVVRPGHTLTIKNGVGGNAIVKLRDAATGHAIVSFFVGANESGSLKNLSDGTYRIQFEHGDSLTRGCRNFIRPPGVGADTEEFSGVWTLATQHNPRETIWNELTFTLYAVAGGNISPDHIDPKDFDAE